MNEYDTLSQKDQAAAEQPTHIRVSAFVAMNKGDRAIGANNDLLHKIPEDLKRFKDLTSGHAIIMGRKTYESIGRPLSNRTNIIITHHSENPSMVAAIEGGCIISGDPEKALEIAKEIEARTFHEKKLAGESFQPEVFIIGGGKTYGKLMPVTDRIYLTLIDSDIPGEVFFPEYENEFTKVIERIPRPEHNPPFEYQIVERE